MIKFMYNGIKEDSKLHKGWYSKGTYAKGDTETITIYADSYARFPKIEGLNIENDTDSQADYFDRDKIRVAPGNKLYNEINEAWKKQEEHRNKRYEKRVGTEKEIKKIETFADLVATQLKETYYLGARKTILLRDKDLDRWNCWINNIYSQIGTKIIQGKKYTRIDVCLPQQSGRYMVDNETGAIYGIKGYGVVNLGHYHGTLDTINNYYWGEFAPMKMEAHAKYINEM
jgi:hypothetical protein